MSIISSKSNRQREGFTPYQSDQDFNQKQLSLLSKLNLNDPIFRQEPKKQYFFDKYSCDLGSITSKKRKLSEELINIKDSKQGDKTFLNRSILGKSSLDNEFINELQFGDSNDGIKKQLSENSCPLPLNPDKPEYKFYQGVVIDADMDKPRFTKTKNLLRNLSNYMHKFILYNKRGEEWMKKYFRNKFNIKNKRKESQSVSASNKSSDLSCFQQMCRIDDTPKIEPSMMQYIMPAKDDSDHLSISTPKGSLSLQQKPPSMKDQRNQQFQAKNQSKNQANLEEVLLDELIKTQIKEFQIWVSDLSIVNFNDYESVWTKPHKYRGLYRIISYKYYRSQAVCDIYRSRLTTKQISVNYLHQFIEGLLQPSQFYRFK